MSISHIGECRNQTLKANAFRSPCGKWNYVGQASSCQYKQVGQNHASESKPKIKWKGSLFMHQNGMMHFFWLFHTHKLGQTVLPS